MKQRDEGDWLGTMTAWLSAISAVIYFFMSYGIKNHILFLLDSFTKVTVLK
jgi:hypothetical protein